MNTCGKCKFGQVMPTNLSQRMCFGSPPQVLIFPSNNKQGYEVRACRPVVSADDRACAKFHPSDILTTDIPVGEQRQ